MATDDHWRIDHTGVGVSNITKAANFHDAALGALGLKPVARITKTFEEPCEASRREAC